jgi:hypothetical protein
VTVTVIVLLFIAISSLYFEFASNSYNVYNYALTTTFNKAKTITLSIKTIESYEYSSLYKPEITPISENKLQNPSFEKITKVDNNNEYYKFVDSNGLMPFPWGFEVQSGSPTCISNSTVAHSGKFSVQITGLNVNDVVLFTLPGYNDKPRIKPFVWYRFEAWVKLDNVQGPGLRLMQQFFNESYIWYPEYFFYGKWHTGTSDWIKLVLDARTLDKDNVLGDPVVEFIGVGTVWIDDVAFYEIKFEFTSEFNNKPLAIRNETLYSISLRFILNSSSSEKLSCKRKYIFL